MKNRRNQQLEEVNYSPNNPISILSTHQSESKLKLTISQQTQIIIMSLSHILQNKIKLQLFSSFMNFKLKFTNCDPKNIAIEKLSTFFNQRTLSNKFISLIAIKTKMLFLDNRILDCFNKREQNSINQNQLQKEDDCNKIMELSNNTRNQLINYYKCNQKSMTYDKILLRMELLKQQTKRMNIMKLQKKQNTKIFDNQLLLDMLLQYQFCIQQIIKESNYLKISQRSILKQSSTEGRRSQSPIKQQKSVSIKEGKQKQIKILKQKVQMHLSKSEYKQTEQVLDKLIKKPSLKLNEFKLRFLILQCNFKATKII